jgi:hypothetical protein
LFQNLSCFFHEDLFIYFYHNVFIYNFIFILISFYNKIISIYTYTYITCSVFFSFSWNYCAGGHIEMENLKIKHWFYFYFFFFLQNSIFKRTHCWVRENNFDFDVKLFALKKLGILFKSPESILKIFHLNWSDFWFFFSVTVLHQTFLFVRSELMKKNMSHVRCKTFFNAKIFLILKFCLWLILKIQFRF